jgi:4a-hydroxytetrahydrobiopterin dehydratase
MSTLDAQEIARRLEGGAWTSEGATIVREIELADFRSAIALVVRIGFVAEAANHHPDLLIHGYRWLRVVLSTHSAGGVTESDLELAAAIDGLLAAP